MIPASSEGGSGIYNGKASTFYAFGVDSPKIKQETTLKLGDKWVCRGM